MPLPRWALLRSSPTPGPRRPCPTCASSGRPPGRGRRRPSRSPPARRVRRLRRGRPSSEDRTRVSRTRRLTRRGDAERGLPSPFSDLKGCVSGAPEDCKALHVPTQMSRAKPAMQDHIEPCSPGPLPRHVSHETLDVNHIN